MRITALFFMYLFISHVSGQPGDIVPVQPRDSILSAAHFIGLVKKARDTMGYVQMIHYYEMARHCDDYSPERFPENWIDTVRRLQHEALQKQLRSNRLISAGNLALQSLNSTDADQKTTLALAAYDTLDDRSKQSLLSTPTILEALHDAYRSGNRFPETFLPDGIRRVAPRDDTTVWLENGRGRYFLVDLEGNGYRGDPAARPVAWPAGLLVYDFAERPVDSTLLFAGVHPTKRNRLHYYRWDQGFFSLPLPETAESVYAVEWLGQEAVFTASDKRVRAFVPERGAPYEELFTVSEKITAMAAGADRLFLGTADGGLLEWRRNMDAPDEFDELLSADTARQITALLAAEDGPDVVLAAGYADGSIRIFANRNGRLEQAGHLRVHRDYISDLQINREEGLLAAVSLDGSMSLLPLSPAGRRSTAPLLLEYPAASAPVGLAFSDRYRCLYIFLKNGKAEVLHLDPAFYVEALKTGTR